MRIVPRYGSLKGGIPSQRASGMIVRSSVSTTPPSRPAATTLPAAKHPKSFRSLS